MEGVAPSPEPLACGNRSGRPPGRSSRAPSPLPFRLRIGFPLRPLPLFPPWPPDPAPRALRPVPVPTAALATLRLARAWASPLPPPGVGASQGVELRVVPRSLPGFEGEAPLRVLEAAPGGSASLPGWVVLHGITVLGLEHPSLLRFVRALAGSGARVLVPEVGSWTRLTLDPEGARRIVRGAVLWQARAPGVLPGGVGVAGFSFGGPQALVAAADPSLERRVRKVLLWGSYAHLPSALHFAFRGQAAIPPGMAEAAGGAIRPPLPPDRPDPYGRWIAGANLLPSVAEGEVGVSERALRSLAGALSELADRWGREELDPEGSAFPEARAQAREALPPEARGLFDLFVPRQGHPPETEGAQRLVTLLARAAAFHHPLLDPLPTLGRLHAPAHLVHGLQDDLIPWTETRALATALRPRAPRVETTLTGLFAHSNDGSAPPAGNRIAEALSLWEGMRRVLAFE